MDDLETGVSQRAAQKLHSHNGHVTNGETTLSEVSTGDTMRFDEGERVCGAELEYRMKEQRLKEELGELLIREQNKYQSAAQERIDQLVQQIESMRIKYESEMTSMEAAFKEKYGVEEIEKRARENDGQLSDALQQFQERIRQVQDDCEKRLDMQLQQARKEHEDRLEAVTLDCESQKSDLDLAHAREREDLRKALDREVADRITRLEQNFADEFDQLNRHHMEEMSKMKEQLTADHQKLCDDLESRLTESHLRVEKLQEELIATSAHRSVSCEESYIEHPLGQERTLEQNQTDKELAPDQHAVDIQIMHDFVERCLEIEDGITKKLARLKPRRRMSGSPNVGERKSPHERRLSGSPAPARRGSTPPAPALDSSIFRPLTPEEDVSGSVGSLSQHLCMSLFSQPGGDNDDSVKRFLAECAERLGESVSTVMDMYSAAMKQVEESNQLQSQLTVGVEERTAELDEALRRLDKYEMRIEEEKNIRLEMGTELQAVEAQLEACLGEKAELEKSLVALRSDSHELSSSMSQAQQQLNQFLSAENELRKKQSDLDQREKLMGDNVGSESKGLLEENQRLAAAKRDLEQQFEKDRAELVSRCQHLEQMLEELQLHADAVTEDNKRDVDDLHQQISALEDKLRSNSHFLEEQTREREQERDEFHKRTLDLEDRLRDAAKHSNTETRIQRELEEVKVQLEQAVFAEKSASDRAELLERDCQHFKMRAEELQSTVSSLDKQLAKQAQENADLERKMLEAASELARQEELREDGADADAGPRPETSLAHSVSEYQDQIQALTRSELQAVKLKQELELELESFRTAEKELREENRLLQEQCSERLRQVSSLELALDKLRYPEQTRPPRESEEQEERRQADDEILNIRNAECESLRTKLEQSRVMLAERTEELDQCRQQLAASRDHLPQVETGQREREEANQPPVEDQSDIKDVSSGADDGISQYAKMLIQSKNQEIDFLNQQVQYHQEDLEEVRAREQELAEYKARYEELAAEKEAVDRVQHQWDDFKNQLSDKEAQLAQSLADLAEARTEMKRLECRCELLENQAEHDSAGEPEVHAQKTDEVNQLHAHIESLATEVENLTKFQHELQEDYDTVSDMLEEKTHEVEQLSQDLLDSKQIEVTLKENETQHELELRAINKDLRNKENIIEEKDEEIHTLKDKLEEKEEDIQNLATEVTILKQRVDCGEKSVARPSSHGPSAAETVTPESSTIFAPATEQAELISATEQAELAKTIEELHLQLVRKDEEIHNLKNSIEQSRASGDGHIILELRQKLEGYQCELDSVRTELDRTQSECTRLHKQMFQVDTEKNELDARLIQMERSHKHDLKVKSAEFVRRVRELESKAEKYEQELNDVRHGQLNESDVDTRVSDVSRKMASQHKLAMDKLCQDYDAKLRGLRAEQEASVRRVRDEWKTKLDHTNQQHSQTLIHTETEHQAEVRKLREQLESERTKMEKIHEEMFKHEPDRSARQPAAVDEPLYQTNEESGSRSASDADVMCRLQAELRQAERLDASLLHSLHARDAGPIALQREISDMTCRNCTNTTLCSLHTEQHNLKRLLARMHREGVQVLTMSELEYVRLHADVRDAGTSPLEAASADGSARPGAGAASKKWSEGREALLASIRELTELVSAADSCGQSDGQNDWRSELLAAIAHVFKKERDALKAKLRANILGDGDGDVELIDRLQGEINELASRQESSLSQVVSADRQSLVAEIRDLRAHVHILTQQSKQDKIRHATHLTSAESGSSKREREITAKLDLLQYRLKQEKSINEDIRSSLDAEKSRAMELTSLLNMEKQRISDLDDSLSGSRTRETSLKQQLDQAQAKVSCVMETFEEERAKCRRLEELVKREQANSENHRRAVEEMRRRADSGLETELRMRQIFEEESKKQREATNSVQSLLEEERQKTQQLQARICEESARFESCRRDLQTRLRDAKRLAQARQTQLDRTSSTVRDMQSLLENERQKCRRLQTLCDAEQQPSLQSFVQRDLIAELESMRGEINGKDIELSAAKQQLEQERATSMERTLTLRRMEQRLNETTAELAETKARVGELTACERCYSEGGLRDTAGSRPRGGADRKQHLETAGYQQRRLTQHSASMGYCNDNRRVLQPITSDDDCTSQQSDSSREDPRIPVMTAEPAQTVLVRVDKVADAEADKVFCQQLESLRQKLHLLTLRHLEEIARTKDRLHMDYDSRKHFEDIRSVNQSLDTILGELKQIQTSLKTSSKTGGGVSGRVDDQRNSVLGQNAELLQFVAGISQEKQQLRNALTHLEEEVSAYRRQRYVHVDGAIDPAIRLTASPDPVRHIPGSDPVRHIPGSDPVRHIPGSDPVRHTPGSDPVRHIPGSDPVRHIPGIESVRHTPQRQSPSPHDCARYTTLLDKCGRCSKSDQDLLKMYGLYMRAESFRRNLVYQKLYLIDLLARYMRSDVEVLRELASMGVHDAVLSQFRLTPKSRFRACASAIIAISRMHRSRVKWTRAKKGLISHSDESSLKTHVVTDEDVHVNRGNSVIPYERVSRSGMLPREDFDFPRPVLSGASPSRSSHPVSSSRPASTSGMTPPTKDSGGRKIKSDTDLNFKAGSTCSGKLSATSDEDEYINRLQNLQTRLTNIRPLRRSRPSTCRARAYPQQ